MTVHISETVQPAYNILASLRIGHGYDLHKLEDTTDEHNTIMLGGVPIPHYKRIVAHSDGDVILHAITDAILGVTTEGDIGSHFPPSNPEFKDAASDKFLIHAHNIAKQKNLVLNNVDVTVVCERPKIGKYNLEIRQNISRILNLDVSAISIKAKTNEKLGYLGNEEAIAAHAVVLMHIAQK